MPKKVGWCLVCEYAEVATSFFCVDIALGKATAAVTGDDYTNNLLSQLR
jgi:hypothetical protein